MIKTIEMMRWLKIAVILWTICMDLVGCWFEAPQTYREQSGIVTGFEEQPYRLVFSGDLSSLAYMPGPDNNCKYIKYRTSVWNSTQTSVDGSRVVSLGFSYNGQRLYVLVKNSTKYYILRYYKVVNFQINQTSEWLLDINIQQPQFNNSIISVSTDGRIAVSLNKIVYVLTLSPNGTSVDSKDSISMPSTVYDLLWHHQDPQILFVAAYSPENTIGQFNIYNATTRSRTGHSIPTKGIGIMTDGSIIVLSNGTALNFYNFDEDDIQLITTLPDYDMNSNSVFSDRSSFVTWNRNNDIKVYQITSPPNVSSNHLSQFYLSNQQNTTFNLLNKSANKPPRSLLIPKPYLKVLLSKSPASQLSFAGISHDANQIYFYRQNLTNFQRWSRCGDGFYLQNNYCFNCSQNCKTCQFLMSQCTSCEEGKYLTHEGDCRKCSDQVDFCQLCSLKGSGVECDRCSVGFVKLKDMKGCGCPEGYEFGTTTACSKKSVLPVDGRATGVELWEFLLGLSTVMILNLLVCFGVYWMIAKRVKAYKRIMDKEEKQEDGIKERIPSASIISDRDQIRQRFMNEGR